MVVLGLLALAAVGLWLVPQDDRGVVNVNARGAKATPGAAGTAGTHDGSAEDEDASVIREIETITGANDGHTLVGRRVDLHVEVQQRANDRAFWVGPRDNRVLVVLARDDRAGEERQRGRPSDHRIAPVHGGQRAAISGVIRPIPSAEERFSWNLTSDDEQELSERKIYIRADSVRSEGHGTF